VERKNAGEEDSLTALKVEGFNLNTGAADEIQVQKIIATSEDLGGGVPGTHFLYGLKKRGGSHLGKKCGVGGLCKTERLQKQTHR